MLLENWMSVCVFGREIASAMVAPSLESSSVFVAVRKGEGTLAVVHAQRVMMLNASDDNNDIDTIIIACIRTQ